MSRGIGAINERSQLVFGSLTEGFGRRRGRFLLFHCCIPTVFIIVIVIMIVIMVVIMIVLVSHPNGMDMVQSKGRGRRSGSN